MNTQMNEPTPPDEAAREDVKPKRYVSTDSESFEAMRRDASRARALEEEVASLKAEVEDLKARLASAVGAGNLVIQERDSLRKQLEEARGGFHRVEILGMSAPEAAEELMRLRGAEKSFRLVADLAMALVGKGAS